MVRLPRNEKQTYRLNIRPQMWPSGLTLVMSWTFNCQGQMWNLLYLNQKMSDNHEAKGKHIKWTPGLKSDQWVWPWQWPCFLNFQGQCDLYLWPYAWRWPRIFMVKFWNSYISESEDRLTLNKEGGSRSFMTMTVAIWWPRSGEKNYHIVTGVTWDVGVPTTRLVLHRCFVDSSICLEQNEIFFYQSLAFIFND